MGWWDRMITESRGERETVRLIDSVRDYEKLHGLEPGEASSADLDADYEPEAG
jgi:hypothetical protein